jgi:hypothetical protein
LLCLDSNITLPSNLLPRVVAIDIAKALSNSNTSSSDPEDIPIEVSETRDDLAGSPAAEATIGEDSTLSEVEEA